MANRILIMTNQLNLFASLNTAANQYEWFVDNTIQPDDALRIIQAQAIKSVVWDLDSLTFETSIQYLTAIREVLQGSIIVITKTITPKIKQALFQIHVDDLITIPNDFTDLLQIIMQRDWVYAQLTNPISVPKSPTATTIQFHDLTIDKNHYRVLRGSKDLGLTPKEFKLFKYLYDHANQVLSRDQLLAGVWGYDIMGTSRMVDIHISHLRDKLEPDPQNPIWIKTHRGFGYVFTKNAPLSN